MDREDEIMARLILDILRTDLKRVFSWGFQCPKIIKGGLRAYVAGFLYEGYIDIKYNRGTDLFEVYTFNDDGSVKDKVEDIYLDSLVDVIDRKIEHCENYEERIKELYGV
jgi:hypothetical protein